MSQDFFEWLPEYETGIRVIDGDHRHLFELARALDDFAAAGTTGPLLGQTIDRLITYVDEHFAREERIMAASGFPEFDAHLVEHRRATDVIYAIRDLYHEAPDDLDVKKVATFFRDWLKHHILDSDRRYVPYVRGEKPGAAAVPRPAPLADHVPKLVDVHLQVPADKEAALRKCAQLLSRAGDATNRLEHLLGELAAHPAQSQAVARAFRRSGLNENA